MYGHVRANERTRDFGWRTIKHEQTKKYNEVKADLSLPKT